MRAPNVPLTGTTTVPPAGNSVAQAASMPDGGRAGDEQDAVLAARAEQRAAVAAQARDEVREAPVAVPDLGLR